MAELKKVRLWGGGQLCQRCHMIITEHIFPYSLISFDVAVLSQMCFVLFDRVESNPVTVVCPGLMPAVSLDHCVCHNQVIESWL